MGLGLDPRPFKENAVEGTDLVGLTDAEFEEYLGLKPLQIKKIKKNLADLGAEAPTKAPVHEEEEEDSAPSKVCCVCCCCCSPCRLL